MKLIYILIFSFLFFYSSLFADNSVDNISWDKTFKKDDVVVMHYTVNDDNVFHVATAKKDTVHEISDGSFNLSKTDIFQDSNTLYGYLDTGSDDGSNDERYYTDLNGINEVTCDDDEVMNMETGECEVPPECSALSPDTVSINKELCSGQVIDWDKGIKGQLMWQDCDETCYIVESSFLSCSDALLKFNALCDPDLNNFGFNCTEPEDGNSSYIMTHSCIPKNQTPLKAPCDDIYSQALENCKKNNGVLNGKCVDNGMIVTNNTLNCDTSPRCDSAFHEVLTSDGSACMCEDGYVRNNFGECWKSLFSPPDENSSITPEQENIDKKAQLDNHLAKIANQQKKSETNNTLSSSTDLSTTNNTLSGLRNDINTSNNLLNSIKDSFNEKIPLEQIDSTDLDDVKNFYSSITNEYSIFSDNVKMQLSDIKNKYSSAKSIFSGGHTFNEFDIGTEPHFEAVVFGETISLDLCPTFSYFAPFVYFFMVGFFMVKVFFFTFNHFMKGFN